MKTLKKIFDLFTSAEKQQSIFLLFLILIMAFFDMVGVGSILPFVAILANPQLVETNSVLIYFYKIFNNFGIISTKQFLFLLGVVVFALLITSIIIRALTNYKLYRFALILEYSISKRLVEGYLCQQYSWFLNKNSADLGKNILSEVNQVIDQTIIPMSVCITQIPVVLVLLTLLIVTNPALALITGLVFMISYLIFFYLIKNFITRIGAEQVNANQERYTVLSEAFNATKEVKIGGLEKFYANRFEKSAFIYVKNNSLSIMIGQLPRYYIEGIAFGGMILLVLVLLGRGRVFANIIPIIALYAFVGYRLLPSLQQIYYASTRIRFSTSALNSLYNNLINLKFFEQVANNLPSMLLTKSIILNKINFSYPKAKKLALKNISLSIPAFSKVGIVGITGSGKTTMVDIILGLLDANQGVLSVDGNIITSNNKRSWQKSIGYVPQQIYLADGSITMNIAFGVDIKNVNYQRVEEVAKIANMHDFVIKELPNGYDTNVGERGVRLSGGQRQRIGIARALYNKPQVLILDEATSALDNLTEQAVMEAINNIGSNITIILIAHRLSTVKNCDTIFLLEQGELKAQGTYKDLLHISKNFQNMVSI
jgi:ABC-type multidrug transport system fused ATPase/permease subunit